MPPTYNLEVFQGQHKVVDLVFTNEDGTPYNLTGRRIVSTVREHPNAADIILFKDSNVAGQIDILDAVSGYARLKWVKADTAARTQRNYSWDVWLITADGPIPWLAPSMWVVRPGVTKPSQTP